MWPYKILVVDDDEVSLAVVRAWLESEGHEVITHHGALGARAVLLREEPDIVVLDLMMPGLAGDALARLLAVAAKSKPPRMILYSGHDLDALNHLATGLPVLGTIAKTADGGAFLSRFRSLVGSQAGEPLRAGTGRLRAR
jgi:DNA-binding response OmpR family regulator